MLFNYEVKQNDFLESVHFQIQSKSQYRKTFFFFFKLIKVIEVICAPACKEIPASRYISFDTFCYILLLHVHNVRPVPTHLQDVPE